MLVFSFNSINSQEGNYLTHVEGTKFSVGNKRIDYRCSFGGEPIAIWGAKVNEEVDSSKNIQVLYVADGLTATEVQISDNIKTDIFSTQGHHLRIKNPSNGSLKYTLSSENEFFVATPIFPPTLSDYSEQIVFNYEIIYNDKKLTDINPQPQYPFFAATGFLVYENTKEISIEMSTWDQLTKWSNYFSQNEQDIYVRDVPSQVEEKEYYGYGFWICGSTQPQVEKATSESIIKLKEKRNYYDYDETKIKTKADKFFISDNSKETKQLYLNSLKEKKPQNKSSIKFLD